MRTPNCCRAQLVRMNDKSRKRIEGRVVLRAAALAETI
jgi:hypothetical protein